jgi:hypothetical protein
MNDLERVVATLVRNIESKAERYLEAPFPARELFENLIPYRTCRTELGVPTSEYYELALTRLLAGEGNFLEAPESVRGVLRAELESPNPDTARFLKFGGVEVRLGDRARKLRDASGRAPAVPVDEGGAVKAAEKAEVAGGTAVAVAAGNSGRDLPATDPRSEPSAAVAAESKRANGSGAAAAPPAMGEKTKERPRVAEMPTPILGVGVVPTQPQEKAVRRPSQSPRSSSPRRSRKITPPSSPGDTVTAGSGTLPPGRQTAAPHGKSRADAQASNTQTVEPGEKSMSASQRTTTAAEQGEKCRYCSGALPTGRNLTYCPHCGQDLTVHHCPACSTELEVGWKFCVTCGRNVEG